MKSIKLIPQIIIIFLFSIINLQAQTKKNLAEDTRITKFKKDMIMYLHDQGEFIEIKYPFNNKDYENVIVVTKHLEINTDIENSLLLVKFSINADHRGIYWGVLSNTKCFLFDDIDDTNEADLYALKKAYDEYVYDTIIYFCFKNLPSKFYVNLPLPSYIYRKELFEIKRAIHSLNNQSLAKTDSAVFFLQRITGINPIASTSNSGCGYYLTSQDYTNWLDWYKKNKTKLYWDEANIKAKPNLNQLDKVRVVN